jgi:zinc transport system permease protein
MDEFVLRAAAGGLAIASIAGPVGALMLWRRMTFFGAAIAESAVLGVTLGLLTGLPPVLGATVICLVLALILESLLQRRELAGDTLIGIVGHGALALALVLLVYLTRVRVDLMGYLFGDILAVSWSQVAITLGFAALALAALTWKWRPILSATIEPDIAKAEGVPVRMVSIAYAVLLALVVALGLRLVGALLIVALLVMPAAAARSLARSPAQMAMLATAFAGAAVVIGVALSALIDWPAGPAVAVAAAALFFASLLIRR